MDKEKAREAVIELIKNFEVVMQVAESNRRALTELATTLIKKGLITKDDLTYIEKKVKKKIKKKKK